MKKLILIIMNIVALAAALVFSFIYSGTVKEMQTDAAKKSFRETMDSMKQLSISFLTSQQGYANNWANLITAREMDLEQAISFVSTINTDEIITAQIIDVETLNGKRIGADNSVTEISYANADHSFKDELRALESCNDVHHLHFTHTYLDPASGNMSVAFCRKTHIKEADGTEKPYLLLRVVPSYHLREQYVLPTGYEKTEMAIITPEGDYVVRSKVSALLNSNNLFSFIMDYNEDMTAADLAQLENLITTNDTSEFFCNNANGERSYWFFSTISGHDDYIFLGYTPTYTLEPKRSDQTVVFVVGGVLLFLMIVDGAYLIHMQNRLKKATAEAQRANMAKTTFLSTMSHDIRTPMNAIVGMTMIAHHHLDDRQHVADCLDKITLSSNHLLTLINDILDISKIESGRLSLSPRDFSIAENAHNLVNIMRPQIKSKSLSFDVRVVNIKHERLFADELRINQIYINLLSNAIKYTPEGGSVVVTIEEQPSPKGEENTLLIFTVEDTGIGMSEEFMAKMYDSFSRAEDARVNTIQGTGLGLAITKQMIDIMEGTIEAESELHKGTKFRVTLDLPIAERSTENLSIPPLRILVVDDDEMFLDSAADLLKEMGAVPSCAKSCDEAVILAKALREKGEEYDVVLVDWVMPDKDGVETIKELHGITGEKTLFILMSSYDWSEVEDEAQDSGADGFLDKPVFRSTVYYKLNELLRFCEEDLVPEKDNYDDLKGLTLLVAEDNDLNWEIIEELLDMEGIKAFRAENGRDCVEKLSASADGEYDAVFMDVQMPVMNGRNAAKEIRSSPRAYLKNIPIIAMTADAFAEDVKACLDAGMNAHVAKPINMQQVKKALRDTLSARS